MIVYLSDTNIKALEKSFETLNVQKLEDKTYRLKNEAELYLASWFGEIAYKRNFLKADSDNNAFLDDNELLSIKGSSYEYKIWLRNFNELNIELSNFKAYDKSFDKNDKSLSDELNRLLSIDTDRNGEIQVKDFIDKKQFMKEFEDFVRRIKNNLSLKRSAEGLKELVFELPIAIDLLQLMLKNYSYCLKN